MNPPADDHGCPLTAAALPLSGRIRRQAPRPRMVGTPLRTPNLLRWLGGLLTATTTLHVGLQAALPLGAAAGCYGDAPAVSAPVLRAPLGPGVLLGIVRGPAWTSARVTRSVHARPRHGTAEVPA